MDMTGLPDLSPHGSDPLPAPWTIGYKRLRSGKGKEGCEHLFRNPVHTTKPSVRPQKGTASWKGLFATLVPAQESKR
ncbi:hypothetical protein U0070_004234 [Myodes glareolus]|uniref:Uncharacterized protein n=1 Tax=Myodes glareolus TaxID=447135 RepID=A0AAW0H7Z6_MYOGA